jgi:soluble epoxide hydrolase / lipid-phosphate phosphatase
LTLTILFATNRGSIAASRLYNYFPERVSAGVFFTVPYAEPSEGFDLDAINAQTKQFIGYEMLGYWYVFTEENSDKLIADHASLIILPTYRD